MAGRDNWFDNAAKEAEASDKAAAARLRKLSQERDRERRERREAARRAMTPPPRPAEAREAAKVFEAVASGAMPPVGAGPVVGWASGGYPYPSVTPIGSARPPRPSRDWPPLELKGPTPEQGLWAILDAVRGAGDSDAVLKAGGEWITKITNGITGIINEAEEQH